MSLSEPLRERYASEVDVDWRYALVFEHPLATTRYLIDGHEAHVGEWAGALVQFEPVPFRITWPTRESAGAWSYRLTIGGIGREAADFLRQAVGPQGADPPGTQTPITAHLTCYIPPSSAQQMAPIEMALTDPTVDLTGLVATGTREDLLSRSFPRLRFTTDKYPGLRRT